ncbi:nucleotide 5'-monophosphate nucleosidase PpnN [Amphritea sp. 2_MG-2023]|uniref:nucleotide 5'-monophosphate nucleosidase PpnN n=1 Tax=Amphritea TaxID=515417 RepID=UPI001C07B0B0|nr:MULTISPECIES: nucleotide 5'-monophosphate nucleosidase PpnN [Amphritea]MBU2965853.1 LOG family protein [Amphritea atlantica]MDO6420764.1 nucleotide 5'-monophosphate nucleosidase PpnN [Amphritea sp. 2_MG-2023]MDX2421207.1 nucleotide 5'-monophosphate nucleosidase PpnN [Amphritea sp.]
MMTEQFVTANITPLDSMDTLSPYEVAKLQDRNEAGLYPLFRQCALAVLNCGSESDSTQQVLDKHKDFDIRVSQKHRGVQLELINAPASAFVDGEIIQGIREHLFSVLRDLLYVGDEFSAKCCDGLDEGGETTNMVFHILRHAKAIEPHVKPHLVVCWGGHSISREEYIYTKQVGYELGLRGMSVCTGCGPGAMKGPMKGATIAHAKQRVSDARYVGISEPGIIAAESPNPIVNELIIMPDIEKRLEAFVRLGHGIIVFPGGAGTAEEILYMLGILLHERNSTCPLPLIFTGPEGSEAYFETVDKFIRATLGDRAASLYEIVVDDPYEVALKMKAGMARVTDYRKATDESFHFNWQLYIPTEFQQPFEPTHENMASLDLTRDQPDYQLAATLRKALSGIVAGNVKAPGVRAIEEFGPFELSGEADLVGELDALLAAFVQQRRMKIDYEEYQPCYRLVQAETA